MNLEDAKQEDTHINDQETRRKLGTLRNILLMSSILIVWIVSAIFSLINLFNGVGILETPWILFSIFLTIAVIIIVIIPLFRNLRVGVREVLDEKEKQKETENSISD